MLKYSDLNMNKRVIINEIIKYNPIVLETKRITRGEILDFCKKNNKSQGWLIWMTDSSNTISRGIYNFPIPSNNEEINHIDYDTGNNNQIIIEKSDEQIEHDINEKYQTIDDITSLVSESQIRSLIVSGSPGFGKTTRINKVLEESGIEFQNISGKVTPRGLYKLLYKFKNKGDIILLDDTDSCFSDEEGLNQIKAVTDSKPIRTICRFVEGKIIDDDTGDEIPKYFEYEGSIIFITNLNLQSICDGNSKLSPHVKAVISRSQWIDLGINTIRERLIAIKMVIEEGMLDEHGLDYDQKNEIYNFLIDNADKFRDLSIRTLINIIPLYKNRSNWSNLVKHTFFR